METAGAEALWVFPSENPSRHIRISTAEKVCWDSILCKARRFQVPAWVPEAGLGRAFCVHQGALGRVPSRIPQTGGVGKGCGGKAFPQEELNAIFCNSIYIVKMTVLVVQMQRAGMI